MEELLINQNSNLLLYKLMNLNGIEDVLLKDFENKFKLIVGTGKDELNENKKLLNTDDNICSTEEEERYKLFVHTILRSENVEEKFEEYKDFIINPRYNSVLPTLIETISKKQNFHMFLKNNFNQIKDASKPCDIVYIYKKLKNIVPEEYEKNKFIIEEIFEPACKKRNALEKAGDITMQDYMSISNLIWNTCGISILQNKNKPIEDFIKSLSNSNPLQIINIGANSIVIKIGDKILKIGEKKDRKTDFDIIEHPRLLRPIIRKREDLPDSDHSLYIEVQEEVETEGITDMDVLEVYKELREAGIIWADAKPSNLGRLKKANYAYQNEYGPEAPNKSLGLIGNDSDRKILDKGELVILDLDYIYKTSDPNAKLLGNVSRIVKEYEKKLENEKEI